MGDKMGTGRRWLGIAALLLAAPVMAEPSDSRQQSLAYMLKHDCGSCHGMTLKGGLGPSLLPELLQQKGHTIDSLSLIIRHGVPDTAMPPWGPILADEDIRWISDQLLKGAN
ncbi:c-type cytochrome [Motiliproteus sp.]|uniref:c-type cytochrome n=1 Tax=Motiliproteus sp. TaxID=1898955 RepID=UPI003BAAF438